MQVQSCKVRKSSLGDSAVIFRMLFPKMLRPGNGPRNPEDLPGIYAHAGDHAVKAHLSGLYQHGIDCLEHRFQPCDAKGRAIQPSGLFLLAVGRMIRDDAVDGTVIDALQQSLPVFCAANRRIHLPGAAFLKIHVRIDQIVGTGFTGDPKAPFFRLPHQLHRFLGGDMADMILTAGFLAKGDVPLYLLPLAGGVDTHMVMESGIFAFMDAAAGLELPLVLAVRHDRDPQCRRPLHGLAHGLLLLDALSVVGKAHHVVPKLLHIGKRSSAALILCDGSIRIHMHRRIPVDQLQLLGQGLHGGGGRLQIRHGADCGKSASCRRPASGLYGLLIRKARFPQMHMYIHETGN